MVSKFSIPKSLVSIPHRYAKNQVAIQHYSQPVMFQFLIGTLKTSTTSRRSSRVVVSIPHRYAKNSEYLYQKTPPGLVSIPHRYAKNRAKLTAIGANLVVSIPHRYAKNFSAFPHSGFPMKFQFLIGTLKTLHLD